ncbi:MAG TPA: hypothetical protein VFT26_02245, partial [Pyrinomonadaceae bacterium]|nr:hypothetical protein [Pyrinomonadaceae bacterium]
MIESDRKNQSQHEEQNQHAFVICADYQQEKEAHEENHDLGRDYVRENRTHEKPVLTLEKRHAGWTVMPD